LFFRSNPAIGRGGTVLGDISIGDFAKIGAGWLSKMMCPLADAAGFPRG
jgi:serine acetyltransferase